VARRVLFVCSGNICRSPLDEYVARSNFSDPDLTFESAGTHAVAGQPATTHLVTVGSDFGLDLRGHRSRSIHDVEAPDLVLCMEVDHVASARHTFPDMTDDSIRLVDANQVADPYGNDLATYRACAAQIRDAIIRLTF
jgi:protein-tyrosine-phosphatase